MTIFKRHCDEGIDNSPGFQCAVFESITVDTVLQIIQYHRGMKF